MTTDVIIPVWGQIELTLQCLKTIREHTKDYRLIVIDNGSDHEEFNKVEDELKNHERFRVVYNEKNLGFVKAVNQALHVSKILPVSGEFIVILNNDVEVVEDWLPRLIEPMQQYNFIAATGPITTSQDCWQGREEIKPRGTIVRILPSSAMLAFFCVAIRKSVINEIGLLDEDFGVGFGDDDDYCHRIHLAGYELGLVQDLVIHHHHRTSFKTLYTPKQIEIMELEARAYFKKKHKLP